MQVHLALVHRQHVPGVRAVDRDAHVDQRLPQAVHVAVQRVPCLPGGRSPARGISSRCDLRSVVRRHTGWVAGTHNEISGTVVGNVVQARNVTIAEGPRPVGGPVWLVPAAPRAWVERAGVDDVVQRLTRGTAPVGVVGPGGFGKTMLAAQVCARVRDRFPGGVLWVGLGEHVPDPVLADKVNDLSEVVSGHRPRLTDPVVAGQHLGRLLAERPATLLVVDDVWSADRLAAFPDVPQLVTTRLRGVLPPRAEVVVLASMSAEESKALLTSGIAGLTGTARLERLTGRWPILLSLVNSAIRYEVMDGTPPDRAAGLIAEQLALDGPAGLDLASADRRDSAVGATIEAGVRRLDEVGRDRFRQLGVFPEDVDIPVEVAGILWGADPRVSRALCRQLADAALVTRSGDAVRLHDVLRTYLRKTLGEERITVLNATLVQRLRAEVPDDWAAARPYTRRHLAGHAAAAGLLDSLVVDAGFLLTADQPELLAVLGEVLSARGRTAAWAYRRVAHHLRDRPAAEHPAYLELAARRAGDQDLAEVVRASAGQAPWRCVAAMWAPEQPYAVLTRHSSPVIALDVARLPDGPVWVFSKDIRGTVRITDITGSKAVEPDWLGSLQGCERLVCVPLRNGEPVLVVCGQGGTVTARNLVTGRATTWRGPAHGDRRADVRAVAWTDTPRGPAVSIAFDMYVVLTWDVTTNRRIGPPLSGTDRRHAYAMMVESRSDGTLAVTVVDPAHENFLPEWVEVWDARTGRRLPADPIGLDHTVVPLPLDVVLAASMRPKSRVVLPDGRELRIHRDDRTIRLWDPAEPEVPGVEVEVDADTGEIAALASTRTSDGRVIIASSGRDDGDVRLWDVSVPRADGPTPFRIGPVTQIVAAGRHVVSTHVEQYGGQAHWVWESGRKTAVLKRGDSHVAVAVVNRAGVTLLLVPWDRRVIEVLDLTSSPVNSKLMPRLVHDMTALTASASPDGSVVGIVATEAPALHGIDLRTSTPLWTVRDGGVTALCATTDRNGRTIVLYADSRNEIHAIDAATGTWVRRRIGTRWAARITADRTRFISAWPGGELFVVTGTSMVVWDLEVGGPITSPTEGAATGHAPVCGTTPDGIRWIATTRGTLVCCWRLDLPVRDDPPPSARGDVAGAEGSVDFAPSAHLTLAWEADLELPITALAVDSDGSFLVGTRRGMVRLRSSPATPGRSRTPRPTRAPEGEALSTGPVVFTRRV
ncbi:WD40 repeat domain-containing protein [Saccharothrix sp. NEAU-S10]|nr:WD40 repeat domain-containing protein [Saccharothrix luteola]